MRDKNHPEFKGKKERPGLEESEACDAKVIVSKDDMWLRLHLFFTSIFVLLLPFNNRYITYLILPWCIVGLFVATKLSVRFTELLKHSALFLLFYFIGLISLSYTASLWGGIKILETMLSLLVLPFLVLLYKKSKQIKAKHFNQLINLYVAGIALYLLVSVVILLVKWDVQYLAEYFEKQSLQSDTSFSKLSFLQHRAYISMYIVWAIVLILHRQGKAEFRTLRGLDAMLVIVFTSYIVLLGSRAGLITLLLVFIFYVWKFCRGLSALYSTFLMLIVLGIFATVLFKFTRLGSTIRRMQEDEIIVRDNRIPIWNGAISAIKEAPVFGYGLGDGVNVLVEKHKENKSEDAYQQKANAHNQYLETMLQSGLPGLISLCLLLLVPLLAAIRQRNERLFLLMAIIILNLLFESMLLRLSGVLFVGFWVSLFYVPGEKRIADKS